VVTPSQGWWSGSNNLGSETGFAPDSNNRQTVLSMPELGLPDVWTVSLYLNNGAVDFGSFDVTAAIEFGAGGSTQIIKVDWVNGTQISLPMNAINVIAEYRHVDITDDGSGIRLGVQLAKGRRGGNQPPVLTMSNEYFVGADSAGPPLEIPKFATRIKFVAVLPGDPQAYVSTTSYIAVSGNNGTSFNVQAVSGDHILENDGLEVFGASRFVRVINGDLLLNVRVAIYAELEG
jgi:hypothetical protein